MHDFIRKECEAAGFKIPANWTIDQVDLARAYSPKRLREMQSIALERGGKCLSKAYVSVFTPLEWECAEGHRWKTPPVGVKQGHWCPKCGGRERLSLQDAQESARAWGGKCHATEYVNVKTPMEWECANGHRWVGEVKSSPSMRCGPWPRSEGANVYRPGIKTTAPHCSGSALLDIDGGPQP
jgi:hypothetical protein